MPEIAATPAPSPVAPMENPLPPLRTKSALVELLSLAAPTVAQTISYTLMQFIDTWMLSKIGDTPATAAASSGFFVFSAISLAVGVLFVVNTLASQSYGQKNLPAAGRFAWQGLWFSLFFSILVLPLPPLMAIAFRGFGHEPALARLEVAYMQIVIGATIIKLASTTLGQFLLAVNRPATVMTAAFTGVAVNALAAWAMVFGHLGFPVMGLAGAAWAQNVGVTVELAVLILFIAQPAIRKTYQLSNWKLHPKEFLTLLKVGIPSGVQTVADVLAWALFSVWVMAQYGTHAMAANTYVFRFMVVSFMPAFGISTAVTALVGRYLGQNRPDLAQNRANLGFIVTAIYMITCGIFFFLGRHVLISIFTPEPEVQRIGATILCFVACYQFFDALYINYNGALRGAGDTFVPAIATGVLNWSISLFGGFFIAKHFPQWGSAGPWAAATAYGTILGLYIFGRFKMGKWKTLHVVNQSSEYSSPLPS